MTRTRVEFDKLPWEIPGFGARSKSFVQNGKKLRLIEFTDNFVEAEWCHKAHLGYVLEGELEIVFHDRIEQFSAGDGIFITGGERQRHKARAVGSARLVLVEDV